MQSKHKLLIGSEWRESKSTLEIRNPYNNEVVGITFLANDNDANDAILFATKAFDETRKRSVLSKFIK